jgi:GNAT superfamily N-acetyltransferase
MLELITELAIFEKAPTEVTVSQQHFVESGFGHNPVWWAYVAEVEGGIKGFALYYVRYSTWKGQKMYLEDIIITEDWRGKGLGSMLMEALLQEAKEKKFQGVCWQVLEWNTPAIKFYERYQARLDSEWINVSVDL